MDTLLIKIYNLKKNRRNARYIYLYLFNGKLHNHLLVISVMSYVRFITCVCVYTKGSRPFFINIDTDRKEL